MDNLTAGFSDDNASVRDTVTQVESIAPDQSSQLQILQYIRAYLPALFQLPWIRQAMLTGAFSVAIAIIVIILLSGDVTSSAFAQDGGEPPPTPTQPGGEDLVTDQRMVDILTAVIQQLHPAMKLEGDLDYQQFNELATSLGLAPVTDGLWMDLLNVNRLFPYFTEKEGINYLGMVMLCAEAQRNYAGMTGINPDVRMAFSPAVYDRHLGIISAQNMYCGTSSAFDPSLSPSVTGYYGFSGANAWQIQQLQTAARNGPGVNTGMLISILGAPMRVVTGIGTEGQPLQPFYVESAGFAFGDHMFSAMISPQTEFYQVVEELLSLPLGPCRVIPGQVMEGHYYTDILYGQQAMVRVHICTTAETPHNTGEFDIESALMAIDPGLAGAIQQHRCDLGGVSGGPTAMIFNTEGGGQPCMSTTLTRGDQHLFIEFLQGGQPSSTVTVQREWGGVRTAYLIAIIGAVFAFAAGAASIYGVRRMRERGRIDFLAQTLVPQLVDTTNLPVTLAVPTDITALLNYPEELARMAIWLREEYIAEVVTRLEMPGLDTSLRTLSRFARGVQQLNERGGAFRLVVEAYFNAFDLVHDGQRYLAEVAMFLDRYPGFGGCEALTRRNPMLAAGMERQTQEQWLQFFRDRCTAWFVDAENEQADIVGDQMTVLECFDFLTEHDPTAGGSRRGAIQAFIGSDPQRGRLAQIVNVAVESEGDYEQIAAQLGTFGELHRSRSQGGDLIELSLYVDQTGVQGELLISIDLALGQLDFVFRHVPQTGRLQWQEGYMARQRAVLAAATEAGSNIEGETIEQLARRMTDGIWEILFLGSETELAHHPVIELLRTYQTNSQLIALIVDMLAEHIRRDGAEILLMPNRDRRLQRRLADYPRLIARRIIDYLLGHAIGNRSSFDSFTQQAVALLESACQTQDLELQPQTASKNWETRTAARVQIVQAVDRPGSHWLLVAYTWHDH